MPAVLGGGDLDYAPRKIGPRLFGARVAAEPALEATLLRIVRSRALARAIGENVVFARFVRAAPGVPETLTLATLAAFLDQRGDDGEPRFDHVLVDLDATGHALMLLELPRVLDGLLGAGRLRRVVGDGARRLVDPTLTRLHLVALPEAMAMTETLALHERLTTDHGVPLGAALVNRMPESLGDLEQDLDALAERARRESNDALARDVALAGREVERRRRADEQVARLRTAGVDDVVVLPELSEPSTLVEAVSSRLAEVLA